MGALSVKFHDPCSSLNRRTAPQAYAQFIEGPNIAVFSVHVVSARICNIQDKVTHWSAADASSSSSSSGGAGGGVVAGK